jgi:hypothetical protein
MPFGLVAGGESEQTRHSDVKRIVKLDEFLAAERVHDRCSTSRKLDSIRCGIRAPMAAKDGDLARLVENATREQRDRNTVARYYQMIFDGCLDRHESEPSA